MVYEGYQRNGEFDGTGTVTWKDNRKFVGIFGNQMVNGEGSFTWPSGRSVKGIFKNDWLKLSETHYVRWLGKQARHKFKNPQCMYAH